MTKDYKYFRSFCSCKDCRYFQCSPSYSYFDESAFYCGRVFSLGIVKRIDPMSDPCKLFVLDLPSYERLCREGRINDDSSPLC